jgi:hypothetical protein
MRRGEGFEPLVFLLTDRAGGPLILAVVPRLWFNWQWTPALCATLLPYGAIQLFFQIRRYSRPSLAAKTVTTALQPSSEC